MKRVGKRLCFSALFFTFLLLGFVVVTWSSMQAHYDLACSTVWAIVTYESGGQVIGSTSTPYQQCEWITTYYDDSGGGGGGGWPPPGEQEPPPGGGGGGTPIINYDTNNSGFVDCYQTAIFHTTSLSITSTCEEVRGSGTPHKALDLWIQNIDGKAAYSVCTGTIQKVTAQRDENGTLTGWGYYVEIKDSAGNIWRYAHLKGTDADPSGVGLTKDGQVTAGTSKVGLCDSSGCEAPDGGTSNAHLHLEYWKDGVKTCPVDKLGNCATRA